MPIGHPNWVYELKHDGFRGILYVDRDEAWLASRKGKKFHQFEPLHKQVLRCLKGQQAILDGEIVVLDEKGRSNFYDLMAHRGEPRYYAFDLMWLNGVDLLSRPLLERKKRLRRLVPATLACCTWSTWTATGSDSSSWCVSRTSKASSASRRRVRIPSHGSR
jgi:bifunctional non-homologous end joining protein LigD